MTRLSAVAMCMTGFFVANAVAEDKPTEGKPKLPDMVYVKVSTSLGDFTLELNRLKAPATVDNFLAYADSGHFEGTMFHRIIKDFMIQGGGFTTDYQQKPTQPPIKNEADNGLKNKLGTIAMARTGDPNSATSQFFINTVDNDKLDFRSKDPGGWGYCVFGRVIDGLETIERIRYTVVANNEQGESSTPLETIAIKKTARVDSNDPTIKKALEAAPRQYEELAKNRPAEEKKQVADATKRAEEAKRLAIEARAKQKVIDMETGKNLVKSKGGDIGKGKVSMTGLWSLDVVEGSGENPAPSSTVTVHYTGWFGNGTKFDSSRDRGQPTTLALNQFIRGWSEGVGGMKKGGKRFLVIPPEIAYGVKGRPGIPPNSTLVFEVELLDFK